MSLIISSQHSCSALLRLIIFKDLHDGENSEGIEGNKFKFYLKKKMQYANCVATDNDQEINESQHKLFAMAWYTIYGRQSKVVVGRVPQTKIDD